MSSLSGRQTQFYIDIVYGIAFTIGFGYLLFYGMDPRVAAFESGLVFGYFLRVWENMSVYERILEEEVAEEAEVAVAQEVEARVPEEAADQVAEEAQERVPEAIEDRVEEKVDDELERVDERVDEKVDDELERVDERVDQRLDERTDDDGAPTDR